MKLKRDMIPIGRENAVSRRQLSAMTGISDREVRREISQLRSEDDGTNMVIVSTSDGSGYFRTDKLDEIEHFIAEMIKRTCSIREATDVARVAADRLKKRQMYGEGLG